MRFGSTIPVDHIPLPGSVFEDGEVIDYAVVMQRLPDEATLESLLFTDQITPQLMEEVAGFVANFHNTANTDEHVSSFGDLEHISKNWDENFAQLKPYIGRSIDAEIYDQLVNHVQRFLKERAELFRSRVNNGRIRDCHGDLRLQHVYIQADAKEEHKIAILDCIEFNERFRYSDVASEVAFLAMELDGACRSDLSHQFIDAYVSHTGDEALRELLPFYCCYRACVRGKVLSFQLDEVEVSETQHQLVRQQAAALFALASYYASSPVEPVLMLVGGLMGTGKSTLALALKHKLGWALFSSDIVRKKLVQIEKSQPQASQFGQGIYGQEWSVRTYNSLFAEAGQALARGHSVILDATFMRRADRLAAAKQADLYNARAILIECTCSREVAIMRLARRWKTRLYGGMNYASTASDGRPAIYDAQLAIWQFFNTSKESLEYLPVNTTQPVSHCVEKVLAYLQIQRFACCLDFSSRQANS